tara:strand:- start:565 stop:921 length:357 start_codon:yes stop_codon:yes gene_type:complete
MSAVQVDGTTFLNTQEAISTAAVFEIDVIDVQQVELFSFDVSWSGGVDITGVVNIEVSNDKDGTFVVMDGSPTTISDTTGKHLYNVTSISYRYMKLTINLSVGNSLFDVIFSSRSGRN